MAATSILIMGITFVYPNINLLGFPNVITIKFLFIWKFYPDEIKQFEF